MAALFSSISEEVLFWLVFLLFPFVAALILRRERRHGQSVAKRADERWRTPLVAALLPALIIAFWAGFARFAPLPHWLLFAGLVLWALGFAVFLWAFSTLGRFYAGTVQVQSDHRVVDTGPYRLVRHPAYAGAILGFFGLGLALQSWVALVLLAGGLSAGLAYRIRFEERFLVTELGDEYVQYMRRTKRIIPFIL